MSDDGCCPAACGPSDDNDCATVCGDGRAEGDETCDPPALCPFQCDDGDPCTKDGLVGDADRCTARCLFRPISACQAWDGCCPDGCFGDVDPDCGGQCGDGERDVGETCDPPSSCPTDCDDGDHCTFDTLIGDADECTAVCRHARVSTCQDGDGCCPAGCETATDDDCGLSCRNAGSWPPEWAVLEEQVVSEMNDYRAAGATCVHDERTTDYAPTGPLTLDPAAREAARCHSMDQGEMSVMSHAGSDGSQFWTRMERAGYSGTPVSENVAAGYDTAASVTAGWMASHEGHCDAIMDPGANEVGIGYAFVPGTSWYDHWWTANFGYRR